MQITLSHVVQENESIRSFYFDTSSPIVFTAGQYIEMTLEHTDVDIRGTKRWFTIASSPKSKQLCITTRITKTGGSSFKRTMAAMESGDTAHISSAMGDFVLPIFNQTPIVFVTGGIGFTPLLSIARWLIDTTEHRPIKCIHGVSTEDDIVFQKEFEEAGISYEPIVTNPSNSWGGRRGLIDVDDVSRAREDDSTLFYLTGPEAMLEKLRQQMIQSGTDPQSIVTDFFPGYPEK